jgi:hypothetical protein
VHKDKLNLAKNLVVEPLIPENFVETWQIRVWKEAFQSFFREADAFSKTKSFKNHKFIDLADKRVLFWYFTNSGHHDISLCLFFQIFKSLTV